jgi:hypothetical protein
VKCPEYQFENLENLKVCEECGADGWVEKYEKELASLQIKRQVHMIVSISLVCLRGHANF